MTAGYVLTETAESELDDTLRFIAQRDGVERALHVLDRFETAFEPLSASPEIGNIRPELTGIDLRWWFVFKFAVIYDPNSKPITILRVLHTARHLDRFFDSESGEQSLED